MRIALFAAGFLAVFIAAASWLHLIIGFALWMLVFGDDSATFGYYALAAAIPLALILASTFTAFAVRWPFGTPMIVGSIAVSVVLEILFVIAIRS